MFCASGQRQVHTDTRVHAVFAVPRAEESESTVPQWDGFSHDGPGSYRATNTAKNVVKDS